LDGEDLKGAREPVAFKLDQSKFSTPLDYVKSFIAEVKKLHKSDARNELRRKESLGNQFKTESLQPSAFRDQFEVRKPKSATMKCESGLVEGYITAMVPILTEEYRAKFNGTKRPRYFKQG